MELRIDEDEAWRAVASVYEAYLARDSAGMIAAFTDECTLWSTDNPRIRYGHEMKEAARQPKEWRGPLELFGSNPVVTIWGDTALVLNDLTAVFDDTSLNESLRVTNVLRKVAGRWQVVHQHEEAISDV